MSSDSLANLLVVGINHRFLNLPSREKLCLDYKKQEELLLEIKSLSFVDGIIICSTCNRVEFVLWCSNKSRFLQWLNNKTDNIFKQGYSYELDQALEHILSMMIGLDSIIVGESQILGQFRNAYKQSKQLFVCTGMFEFLIDQLFCYAKQIRYETSMGKHSVSLAQICVQNSKKIIGDLSTACVVFIGSGHIISQHLRAFFTLNPKSMAMVCRNKDKVLALSHTYNLELYVMEDIVKAVDRADIVIAATSSGSILLDSSLLERRESRRCLLYDLSVPRNIDNEIAKIPGYKLYNMDDIQLIRGENEKIRINVAEKARLLVKKSVAAMVDNLNIRRFQREIAEFVDAMRERKNLYLVRAVDLIAKGGDVKKICSDTINELILDLKKEISFRVNAVIDDDFDYASYFLNIVEDSLARDEDAISILEEVLYKLTNKVIHKPICIFRNILAEKGLKISKKDFEHDFSS